MFILYLQYFAIWYCLLFLININVKFVTPEANVSQKEFIGGNEDCIKEFKKNRIYSLEIKENCRTYYLHLNFKSSTSIINVTTSIYHKQDKNLTDFISTFKISFNESIDPREENKISLKEWHENTTTIPSVRTYLSHSSKVIITISGTGDWSYYDIHFSFKEIEYRLETLEANDQNVKVPYKPNSVSLLRLRESETVWRGVKIRFENLILNTEMGEYILIGAGTQPFETEQSRPLFISQVKTNSTFFVDDSSAFVAFVSGSDPESNKDFKILWEWIKEETVSNPEDPAGILNSSLICFYNYTEAKKEFEKPKDKRFEAFRLHFLNVAKECFPKEYKNLNLKKVSVDLFGKEKCIESSKETKDSFNALAIHIKVMYNGLSIFTWRQLQSIIKESEQNSSRIVGYKVGKCPDEPQYSELIYKEKSILMYALVPVFGLFALLMWAWKQNLFSQNCLTEKEEKLSFDHLHAEPNPYETTTIPKVCRYDEEGRRETLIQGTLRQEDGRETRNITMVEMNTTPSASQKQDTLTRYLSNRNRKSRPSLQSLFGNSEKDSKQSHSEKIEKNESDHLYDSVNSSKQLDETRL